MHALPRLRKPAIWTALAILLLLVLYAGTYFRVVSRVYVAESFEDESGITMHTFAIPRYMLRWPAPSLFNNSGAQEKLVTLFEPMNYLDRCLRPDVWINPEPVRVPMEVTISP